MVFKVAAASETNCVGHGGSECAAEASAEQIFASSSLAIFPCLQVSNRIPGQIKNGESH